MLDFLLNIDSELLLFFNGCHNRFFDCFMMAFTGRYVWIPMYAVMAVMLFWKYNWRVAVVYAVAIGCAILITDQMIASHIRPFFERLRPSHLDNPISGLVHVVDGYRGGTYGFPSCHAANSFCLAVFLTLAVREKRFALFVFAWAILHSYTRLYLGVHYPGDLTVGAIVGSCVGAVICLAAKLVCRFARIDKLPVKVSESIAIKGKTVVFRLTDTVVCAMLLTTAIIIIYSVMCNL